MKLAHAGNSLKAAIIVVLIAIVCLPSQVSAAGAPVVSVSAPTQAVSSGTQFTVSIMIQPNNAIAGAQFNLSFNPSLVIVNSVTEGNLFNQGGASTYFMPGTINNTTGSLTGVADVITTPGETVSAMGTLAIINMTAGMNSGTSALTLSNVIVGNINGQAIGATVVSGQVIIGGVSTTTPTTTTTTTPTTTTTRTTTTPLTTTTPTTTTPTTTATRTTTTPLTTTTPTTPTTTTTRTNTTPITTTTPTTTPTTTTTQTNTTLLTNTAPTTTTSTTTTTTTTTTPTATTSAVGNGVGSSGGGITLSTTPGVTDVGSYVNAQGVFNQNINISSDDNEVLVTIPSGTTGLTSSGAPLTQISILNMTTSPALPIGAGMIDLAYDITPNGITFNPAVTLEFTFNPALIPADVDPSTLQIAYYDSTQNIWVTVPSTVNTANNTISAQISHFTPYAVTYGVQPVLTTTTTTTSTTTTGAATIPLTTTLTTTMPTSTSVSMTPQLETTSAGQIATTSNTSTSTNVKVVRLYILAMAIGIAVFLITATATLIWLRHRDLVKTNER